MTVGKALFFDYSSSVNCSGVYRRRRLGALMVALLAVGMIYAQTGSADSPSDVYTVASGDTLWEISTEHYSPSEDPRVVIETIREENGLMGYGLQPGQRLELPR
jgi:LysM repeat protein